MEQPARMTRLRRHSREARHQRQAASSVSNAPLSTPTPAQEATPVMSEQSASRASVPSNTVPMVLTIVGSVLLFLSVCIGLFFCLRSRRRAKNKRISAALARADAKDQHGRSVSRLQAVPQRKSSMVEIAPRKSMQNTASRQSMEPRRSIGPRRSTEPRRSLDPRKSVEPQRSMDPRAALRQELAVQAALRWDLPASTSRDTIGSGPAPGSSSESEDGANRVHDFVARRKGSRARGQHVKAGKAAPLRRSAEVAMPEPAMTAALPNSGSLSSMASLDSIPQSLAERLAVPKLPRLSQLRAGSECSMSFEEAIGREIERNVSLSLEAARGHAPQLHLLPGNSTIPNIAELRERERDGLASSASVRAGAVDEPAEEPDAGSLSGLSASGSQSSRLGYEGSDYHSALSLADKSGSSEASAKPPSVAQAAPAAMPQILHVASTPAATTVTVNLAVPTPAARARPPKSARRHLWPAPVLGDIESSRSFQSTEDSNISTPSLQPSSDTSATSFASAQQEDALLVTYGKAEMLSTDPKLPSLLVSSHSRSFQPAIDASATPNVLGMQRYMLSAGKPPAQPEPAASGRLSFDSPYHRTLFPEATSQATTQDAAPREDLLNELRIRQSKTPSPKLTFTETLRARLTRPIPASPPDHVDGSQGLSTHSSASFAANATEQWKVSTQEQESDTSLFVHAPASPTAARFEQGVGDDGGMVSASAIVQQAPKHWVRPARFSLASPDTNADTASIASSCVGGDGEVDAKERRMQLLARVQQQSGSFQASRLHVSSGFARPSDLDLRPTSTIGPHSLWTPPATPAELREWIDSQHAGAAAREDSSSRPSDQETVSWRSSSEAPRAPIKLRPLSLSAAKGESILDDPTVLPSPPPSARQSFEQQHRQQLQPRHGGYHSSSGSIGGAPPKGVALPTKASAASARTRSSSDDRRHSRSLVYTYTHGANISHAHASSIKIVPTILEASPILTST